MKAENDKLATPGSNPGFPWGARRLALGVVAFALLGSACGPIQSTQRINQAAVELERARVVGSYQTAPYEYKTAQYYLEKAKEEWGYSDFSAAYDYATEAKSAAEAARLKAKGDPWPGHPTLGEQIKDAEFEGPEGFLDEADSITDGDAPQAP